ncbi:sodium/bile acid cotransporter 7 isoform X2 [Calliopsis andreniformis]|uniref:sodium/bile acid cotransporter 7 isoform X2 n=1 Tax=Calliopsis andreniformis TaxID=337506 RepID=UPI003FCCE235
MYLKYIPEVQRKKKQNELLYRYGYFLIMLLCMVFATVKPHLGKTNGLLNGNIIIRYFAVPLTYLEAGLLCDPKTLYSTLSNGYLLVFTMTFIYILMPFLMRVGVCLLTYANVNVWLLKGMELGASTPPLVGVNVKETIYSTIIPLLIGIAIQTYILKYDFCFKIKSPWFSQGLLLATAYHWFCDAVSVDASSLQATDILLCVLIACVGQLFVSCLCWILCSRWFPRNILLAALFTSTHKSVGLGSWVLRGAYHGSAHGPAVNLPLSILPVAQVLLGSLLASWLSP